MYNLENIGQVFKKIRESKNFSLRDVANDKVSIAAISKFERGKNDIGLSKFLSLIFELDVTIDEFNRLLTENIIDEKYQLIKEIAIYAYKEDVKSLNDYHLKELEKYHKTQKKKYLYNAIMIESFMVNITGGNLAEEKIRILTDYLFSVSIWGRYELMIFGNGMFAINHKTLDMLLKEISFKARPYQDSEKNFILMIQLYMQAIQKFLAEDNIQYAKKYLSILDKLKIHDKFLYEKSLLKEIKASYEYKVGNKEKAKKYLADVITVYQILGCEEMYRSALERYQQW